ncbi:MAG: chalcone isomerase family protein [Elusimicrobia bacterium]|nr:chalcone isomerase family protein [Elusimicrobiota bacterium]
MKKFALLALLAAPCLLSAAETEMTLKGVSMPMTLQQDGRKLELNGMGLRTKIVFKVYVAGLYLEKTSRDGMAVASSEQLKRIELVFLRSVDGKAVAEAIAEGFANNAGAALPALKDRITRMEKMIPDVKKGDRLVFVYRPGIGIEVTANGKPAGAIEGKDFADVLFKVWVGDKPADKSLKNGLLGL